MKERTFLLGRNTKGRLLLLVFAVIGSLALINGSRGESAPAHPEKSLAPAVVGNAFDLKTGELLYSEMHCLSESAQSRTVIYRDPQNALLADKTLNYVTGAISPSFVQKNHYSQQFVSVDFDGETVKMQVATINDPRSTEQLTLTPKPDLPVVIDAGFDAFVKTHWQALTAGDRKRFQFPFASQEGLVELRIGATRCDYDSPSDQCFKLEMNNWFLRALVAPIELGYDRALQRLTRYRGLSNIGDGQGNGLVVDIVYRYEGLENANCEYLDHAPSPKIKGIPPL